MRTVAPPALRTEDSLVRKEGRFQAPNWIREVANSKLNNFLNKIVVVLNFAKRSIDDLAM